MKINLSFAEFLEVNIQQAICVLKIRDYFRPSGQGSRITRGAKFLGVYIIYRTCRGCGQSCLLYTQTLINQSECIMAILCMKYNINTIITVLNWITPGP